MQATRNGYFFVVDRVTGEHIVNGQVLRRRRTGPRASTNAAVPSAILRRTIISAGALVSPQNAGATNWAPPAFSPRHRPVLCLEERELLDVLPDRNRPARRDGTRREGRAERHVAGHVPDGDRLQDGQDRLAASLRRIRIVGWDLHRPRLPDHGRPTAVRWRSRAATSSPTIPRTGVPLWHARLGEVSSAPQTYLLDGRQYILAAAVDMLYAFALAQ